MKVRVSQSEARILRSKRVGRIAFHHDQMVTIPTGGTGVKATKVRYFRAGMTPKIIQNSELTQPTLGEMEYIDSEIKVGSIVCYRSKFRDRSRGVYEVTRIDRHCELTIEHLGAADDLSPNGDSYQAPMKLITCCPLQD